MNKLPISKNHIIPSFQNVLLTSINGVLDMRGTNQSSYGFVNSDISSKGNYKCLVNYEKLVKILKTHTNPVLSLEKKYLNIKSKKANNKLEIYKLDKFPVVERMDNTTTFPLGINIKPLLKLGTHKGTYNSLSFRDGYIYAVSTDNSVIGAMKYPFHDCVIPTLFFKHVERVGLNGNIFVGEYGDYQTLVKPLKTNVPDYKSFLPTSYDCEFNVDIALLKNAIDNIVTYENTGHMMFDSTLNITNRYVKLEVDVNNFVGENTIVTIDYRKLKWIISQFKNTVDIKVVRFNNIYMLHIGNEHLSFYLLTRVIN